MSQLRRSGFTWIELVVVVFVLVVAIGLLLPAIHNGMCGERGQFRRTQCTNQLKNLILSLHNYEGINRVLPGDNAAGPGRFSVLVDLLPAIEQQALFDKVNFDVAGPSIAKLSANLTVTPANTTFGANPEDVAGGRHREVATTKVNAFTCPSDAGPIGTVGNSYCPVVTASGASKGEVNLKALWPATAGEGLAGPVAAGAPVWAANLKMLDIAGIQDGSSNTAGFAERVKGKRAGRNSNPQNQAYRGSGRSSFTVTDGVIKADEDNAAMIDKCRTARAAGTATATGNDTSGSYWFQHTCAFLGCANTMAPPNSAVCDDGIGALDIADTGIAPVSSYHGGGANVGMMDGAIRFLIDSTDLKIIHSLGTVNGAERHELPQ